eukprot:2738126-Pleurochrysis_carterae.AAC.2
MKRRAAPREEQRRWVLSELDSARNLFARPNLVNGAVRSVRGWAVLGDRRSGGLARACETLRSARRRPRRCRRQPRTSNQIIGCCEREGRRSQHFEAACARARAYSGTRARACMYVRSVRAFAYVGLRACVVRARAHPIACAARASLPSRARAQRQTGGEARGDLQAHRQT